MPLPRLLEGSIDKHVSVVAQRAVPELIVVDAACRVVACSGGTEGSGVDELLDDGHANLRVEAETVVAGLVRDAASSDGIAVGRCGERVIRVAPLRSASGRLFALHVEAVRNLATSISRATRRYALTRRESEVLTHIVRGSSAGEIAAFLYVAESTIQGYFKRLLAKTRSRNRAMLVASVLHWEQAPASEEQPEQARG